MEVIALVTNPAAMCFSQVHKGAKTSHLRENNVYYYICHAVTDDVFRPCYPAVFKA